jgi:dethiobiotin synthase
LLLVEGAGGLMVPLGWDFLTLDVIAQLDCAVIVAARNRLGTINHTALTVESLRSGGIKVKGIVFNNFSSTSGKLHRIFSENIH